MQVRGKGRAVIVRPIRKEGNTMFKTHLYRRSGMAILTLAVLAGSWGCVQGALPLTDNSLSGLLDALSQ